MRKAPPNLRQDNVLQRLDIELLSNKDIAQTGEREYCLGDPVAARAVLLNQGSLYEEHSDFFNTRRGLFGPRDVQLKIRREARALLLTFFAHQSPDALASLISSEIDRQSEWPDAGNGLIFNYLKPIVLGPANPPRLHRLLEEIVQRSAYAKARENSGIWRRRVLQFRAVWHLSSAIEARQALGEREATDLLDIVANATMRGTRIDELVDVYLSFVISIAGTLGFVLGWSVYLLGKYPRKTPVPMEWVVKEALRLWPVAWMLTRRPARGHEISDVPVTSNHSVVACPYMVHRNPKYWEQPLEFQPERWANAAAERNPAYIPFGHGSHRCIVSDLSINLVVDVLRILTKRNTLKIQPHDVSPSIGPALAPPAYRLILGSYSDS